MPSNGKLNDYVPRISKAEFDDELVISGWETGRKGKAAGAFMVKCLAANGVEFPVTPAMELPIRIEMAKKMKKSPQ